MILVNYATQTYLHTSTVLRRGPIVSDKAHGVGYMQERDSGAGLLEKEDSNRAERHLAPRPPFWGLYVTPERERVPPIHDES